MKQVNKIDATINFVILGVVLYLLSIAYSAYIKKKDRWIYVERIKYCIEVSKILDKEGTVVDLKLPSCDICKISNFVIHDRYHFELAGNKPENIIIFKKKDLNGKSEWVCTSKPHNYDMGAGDCNS